MLILVSLNYVIAFSRVYHAIIHFTLLGVEKKEWGPPEETMTHTIGDFIFHLFNFIRMNTKNIRMIRYGKRRKK